mmetsp:Transcript_17805/g.20288  ORF Transcript_17805/g.20288 Transcript_17805/m.20288 type:complete len:215 (+) Transcript_17805:301-945(+)
MNYIACSSESNEGFCPFVNTQCNALNTCRTCSRNDVTNVGECTAINYFPNATVEEYGTYSKDVDAIMAEIYARGPVQASVNGTAIKDYKGGVIDDEKLENMGHNHGVSIVGWGEDEDEVLVEDENGLGRSQSRKRKYWIVRNSLGQYWGEMGFFRVQMGRNLIGIENHVVWGTPGRYSTSNYPCAEDGSRCNHHTLTNLIDYIDPSDNIKSMQR